ncbi:unnamed protein product [Rotaria socialis]|uniref:Carbonic anhydrase n=1 Tax=Rotaria socialis TaxID=392032 RepID=A0A817UAH7_9BILA|nr:unnamed protein product [Rotaria socialis]CAF4523976.1 unnamed protein product [Rotaria socialis]
MKTYGVCIITILFVCVSANQWNYGHLGPDVWSEYYPLCAGKSQSPINILTACTLYRDIKPFEFISTHATKNYFTVKNNGHTIISIMSTAYEQLSVQLRGGGLNGTFDFVNFHLHWGENYKSGSEHQVNGIKYAGEIHFVYKNYLTSQMAVLALFMQSYVDHTKIISDNNDQTRDEWQRYFDMTRLLRSENDSVLLDLNVTSLMGENLQDFWRYKGSLTTPPCTEGIIWTIFTQPIIFIEEQLKLLRDNVFFEDYRGPQPLYNRIVYRNFLHETLSTIPDYNRCVSVMHHVLRFISFFFLVTYATHEHDWDYGENGPDVWHERYPNCAGQLQSPIDILTACTTYKNFTPFTFGAGYNEEHNFTIRNNGHTIVGTFNNETYLSTLRLRGGDIKGTFEFVNFHLHWGENHRSGSEHEVNGIKYPGEIHFVYANPSTNQTAVLGIFMQSIFLQNETEKSSVHLLDEESRREWKRFFDLAQTLTDEDNSTVVNLSLSLLMGDNLQDFWRYEGSFTTPPCTEGVIWTIFKEPIFFVESEFSSFRRKIYFEDYRRPQPLYTRDIYRNFFNETLSSIPDYQCCPKKDSINTSFSTEVEWNYGEYGPDVWNEFNGTCGEIYQSPINIKTACTVYQSFPPFQFSPNYNQTQDFLVTNNGHGISATQANASAYPMTHTGGGLDGTFQFTNFHIHWGENYNVGSEHQINSIKYAGEIHFVHMNYETNKYGILGVLIDSNRSSQSSSSQLGRRIIKRQTSNTGGVTQVTTWESYASIVSQLNYTNASATIRFKLSTLMTTDFNIFYRYTGSKTTPPCIEGSSWTVFKTPIYFNNEALERFRPVQPLDGRMVYRSFPNDTVSSISDYYCCTQNAGRSFSGVFLISLIGKQLFLFSWLFTFYVLLRD